MVSTTQVLWLTTACNFSSRGSDALSWTPPEPSLMCAHTPSSSIIKNNKHSLKNNNNNKKPQNFSGWRDGRLDALSYFYSLDSSIHVKEPTTACNSTSRRSDTPLWPVRGSSKNLRGAMKVKAPQRGGSPRPPFLPTMLGRWGMNAHVRTQKMVNCAWAG